MERWVCARNGSKAPMRAFEPYGASTTDPATWSDFETACEAVKLGYYDNIGFVFASDGYVGIDIDLGFDEESGLPTKMAVDIINRCRSYTELSRSGRGYHILLKGDLPFDGRNGGQGVEIYKTKRYFIMTGKRIVYDDIIANQDAIDFVVNTYCAEAASCEKTKNGTIFPKLYSPRWNKPHASGRTDLKPVYPEIAKGCRHISLVSLAGSLISAGYKGDYIYKELLRANGEACKPPLSTNEIQQIVKSVRKYGR